MTHPNRVRLSKLTLGLLAVLATAPVFAQSTSAGVGGRVTAADGQPVAGAEVIITHTESGTVSRATTDADGRYNARGLRVGGPYTVTINKAGAGAKQPGRRLPQPRQGQPRSTLTLAGRRRPRWNRSQAISLRRLGSVQRQQDGRRHQRRPARQIETLPSHQPQHPGLRAPRPARACRPTRPAARSPPAARTRATTRSRIDGVSGQRLLRPGRQQPADPAPAGLDGRHRSNRHRLSPTTT